MELRIAIVEDQKFEAQRLERLLRQAWGDPVVCDLYESGDAFLHRAAAGPYAVVFLDICMEGTNGIGTALKRLSIGHGILCNKFAKAHPQIALKTINRGAFPKSHSFACEIW